MKNTYLGMALLLVAATLGATALVYPQLPARIALHWNLAGALDRDGPRVAAFLQPALMAALLGLWCALPRVSPRNFGVEAFHGTWWFCAVALLALLAWIQALVLWHALGGAFDMGRMLLGGVALCFALLGNVLGKVRRNFWLGIRTPWTLADERVWYATHRVAGRTMVAAGLIALGALWLSNRPAMALAILLAGGLAPAVYSAMYAHRLARRARE